MNSDAYDDRDSKGLNININLSDFIHQFRAFINRGGQKQRLLSLAKFYSGGMDVTLKIEMRMRQLRRNLCIASGFETSTSQFPYTKNYVY